MANKKTLEIVQVESGEWLWRFKAGNGRQVSWSGETYHNREDAENGALAGSPAVSLDWENNTFKEYSSEEGGLIEGKLRKVVISGPALDELRGEDDTEKLAASARSTLKNPIAHEMIDSNARRDESGHIVIETSNGFTQLHLKEPDSNNCAILGCKVKLVEE